MEQRGKFIDAAIAQGHGEDLAIYIFDEIIEPFAGYGFNKSHAASLLDDRLSDRLYEDLLSN